MTSQEIQVQLRRRTPPQKRISASKARFNVAVWGRQSGKTTFGLDKMIWKPLTGRYGGIYWYVLQTYSAAEIAFDRMARLTHGTDLIRRKPNESELCFFLENGANVFYKSGDKPQNLRAETLDGCAIDECRQQKPMIWSQIIMPMLGRRNGWCDFYSTPNGFDWFYDLYQMATVQNPDGEWAGFHAPSTEAWWWTPKQIAQAKASMSESEFAQEILAEFRSLTHGSAYVTFSQDNLTDQNPFAAPGQLLNPWLPVVVGLDFNLDPMAWSIGQNKGSDWYWADEVWLRGSHTPEASKELVARLEGYKRLGFLRSNPQVIICGDATSKAGQRAAAGQSDYDILLAALSAAGITWENRTPDSNPGVKDRVNAMNAKWRAADGTVHMWISPTRCPNGVRDAQRVVWKPNSTVLDQTSDPTLTHASDGQGYAVAELTPIQSVNDVGELRVIRR